MTEKWLSRISASSCGTPGETGRGMWPATQVERPIETGRPPVIFSSPTGSAGEQGPARPKLDEEKGAGR